MRNVESHSSGMKAALRGKEGGFRESTVKAKSYSFF